MSFLHGLGTPGTWPAAGLASPLAGDWHQRWQDTQGGHCLLRPLRPADAPLLGHLLNQGLGSRSRFHRFLISMGTVSGERLAEMCALNFEHDAAYLVTRRTGHLEEPVAEGRLACCAGTRRAEFAIAVADRWQQHGIGQRLLHALAEVARLQGATRLCGEVWHDNPAMLGLMQRCHFQCSAHRHDPQLVWVERDLHAAPAMPPEGLASRVADALLRRVFGVHVGLPDRPLH